LNRATFKSRCSATVVRMSLVLDVDGVVTFFRSAWKRVHNILGVGAEMGRSAYKMGLIDYRDWALVDSFLWRGVGRRWVEVPFSTRPGLEELINYVRSRGLKVVGISAGVSFTRRIQGLFDFFVVNDLLYKDNALYTINVVVEEDKVPIVDDILNLIGVRWDDVIAVGDSPIDIPILEKAGYSIAFNPLDYSVISAADCVIYSEDLYPVLERIRSLLQ